MRLSISLSTAVSVLAAVGTADALAIPDPRTYINGLQQTFDFQLDKALAKLDQGRGLVLLAIASYLDQPFESIPESAKKAWLEVSMEFPAEVAKLNFKSKPKKAKQYLSQFDFSVTDAKHPNHQLRGKLTPVDLGVDTVKQYTGYLDVEDEDKHFFYWFFESRNDPKNDPVILWLNGGPGCSSLTGLFFELGSSLIGPGLKPIYNPYSWNNNALVIYLDQPVNVGYSYSLESVTSTIAAGKDVYAFLELFYKQFPQYNKGQDFHIAGESYAGHYIPVFASEILSHEDRSFNLSLVLIGNGLTDPLTQYNYYEPMACGEGGEPSVLEPEECQSMLDAIPRCTSLIESCYNSGSVWSCVPATIYCNNAQMGPYQKTGRNVYDIRTMCEGGNLCYKDLGLIDEYLNQAEVQKKLGAEVEEYQSCNFDVNRNFVFAGDWMKPYHRAVIELLEKDLPVLIYAGDKDFICNWLGNQAWVNALEWSGHDDFAKQPIKDWTVAKKAAGQVKNHKNLTFLRVFGAGHMVPYDQPENSLDMVNRWINGDRKFK